MQHPIRRAVLAAAEPAAGFAAEHRRVAAPVEEHEGLLGAREHALDRGHALGREAVRERLATRVDDAEPGHPALAGAFGKAQQAVAAAARGQPGFQRRRGRAEHHRHAALRGERDREIAGAVTHALLLLVRGVVLLVDHDGSQPRHRREHRQPRAHHHARAPLGSGEPVRRALAVGQVAVHERDRLAGQPPGHLRHQLRRECDLRHQQQDLRVRAGPEHVREPAQVDLGLAAPRHAVQQVDGEALGRAQCLHRGSLGLRQAQRVGAAAVGARGGRSGGRGLSRSAGRTLGARADRVPALAGARERRAARFGRGRGAQQLRDRRQRDFAQLAVVIARREPHQREPAGVGPRRVGEDAGHAAQARRRHFAVRANFGDDAHAPAAPPRHDDPRARHDGVALPGFDPVVEGTRCVVGARRGHVERHARDRSGGIDARAHGRQPEFTLTLPIKPWPCYSFSRSFTKAVEKTVGSFARSARNPRRHWTSGRLHLFVHRQLFFQNQTLRIMSRTRRSRPRPFVRTRAGCAQVPSGPLRNPAF